MRSFDPAHSAALILVSALCIGAPPPACAYDVSNEVVTTTIEWGGAPMNTANLAWGCTPIATRNGATYLVFRDPDRRPKVVRRVIASGQVEVVFLDNESPTYYASEDGHNKYSLGIDRDGYIHIVGDMHNHSSRDQPHLPARYQNCRIPYWVSTKPHSIAGGFTFRGYGSTGNPHQDTCPPGQGFTYPEFVNDNSGRLYYFSRQWVGDWTGSWAPGAIGVGLKIYDEKTKLWTARGGLAPNPPADSTYKVILWEDNGAANSAYQPHIVDIRFDASNRMHFVASVNNDNSKNPNNDVSQSSTHLVYAYSDDGGQTFCRASGTRIASLPMRADPGPDQGDVVFGDHHWIDIVVGAIVLNGRPVVSFTDTGPNRATRWCRYDGGWSAPLPTPLDTGWRRKYFVDRYGVVTLPKDGTVHRTTVFGNSGGRTHTGIYPYFGLWDREYLRTTGKIRYAGWSGSSPNRKIYIATLDITPDETQAPVAPEGLKVE
ncbi:MAG: BNR-4 repeat-containing protein [Kiritimatiellae bacterium]|nr:BNR-4 repeat-containing protein [Kiritimatiellia bacterium]